MGEGAKGDAPSLVCANTHLAANTYVQKAKMKDNMKK